MSTPESQIPTQPGTLSVPEFAAQIKQKYPEYQSLDDHELTGRILAKYSTYATKVKFADDDEATKVTEIRVNAARGTRDAAVNSLLPNSPPQSLSSDVGSRLVPAREQIEAAQTRPRTVTPRVAGQLEPGNVDLNNRPVVKNQDGSISTVRSMSANIDGREVLLPTVSDDGRVLSNQQAIEQYKRTGKHLGVFDSPENATAYAQQLHQDQAAKYAPPQPSIPLNPLIQKRLDVAQQSRKQQEMQLRVQQARDARARARPAPTQSQSLAGTDLGNLLLASRAQSRGQAQPNLTASPHQQRPLASKFASVPQRSIHQRQGPSLTDQAKSMVAKEVADYYGGQPFEQDLTNVGEGIGSAVASTGRQAISAADLAMKYGPGNFSRLIPMVRRQQDEAIAKGREGIGKLERGVEASAATHPAEGGLDEFRQGLERGAGSAAIDLPKLMAGGELLGAANLPIQGALSREEEGLPGLIKGAAGGLVYHYGMGLTGKAIGRLGNALFWTAAPTAQGMASGQSFGKALGEALPMGALAGMGEGKPVEVRDGESVRPATVDDLPKIASKDLEVVPPERTGLITPFGRKASADSTIVENPAQNLTSNEAANQATPVVPRETPQVAPEVKAESQLKHDDHFFRIQDNRHPLPERSGNYWMGSDDQQMNGVSAFVDMLTASKDLIGGKDVDGLGINYGDSVKEDGGKPVLSVYRGDLVEDDGGSGVVTKPEAKTEMRFTPEDVQSAWLRAIAHDYPDEAARIAKEPFDEQWDDMASEVPLHDYQEAAFDELVKSQSPAESPQVGEVSNKEALPTGDTLDNVQSVSSERQESVTPLSPDRRQVDTGSPDGVDRRTGDRRTRQIQNLREERRSLKEQRDTAQRAAETDYMTQLGNRAALDKALPAAEADPNISVVSFDANEAGKVNKMQEHGPVAGDSVINRVANAIKQAAVEFGVAPRIFRRGGDEFVGLFPKDKAEQIRNRAEEIAGVETYQGIHGQTGEALTANTSLTGSIGDTFETADAGLQGRKASQKARQRARDEAGRFAEETQNFIAKEQPNAIDQGIEQGRDEAKLPGVREGEDLQAHPEQVRPGASNEAENSSGTKTSGQEQPKVKDRSLPKTLEAAQMDKGENTQYEPVSLLESETAGRQMLKDKGVDGVIEHVLHGPPSHEIAPAAFAALNEMVRQEKVAREGSDLEAEAAINAKRRQFAGDLAERFTELGQTINAVKTIENFAPDKALYLANKLSMEVRKRGLSAEEDARIGKEGEENAAHIEALKTIDAGLKERARILDERENAVSERESKLTDAEKAQGKTEPKAKPEKPKTDYKSRLKAQSDQAKATLKVNLGKLNFGKMTVPVGEKGAVRVGIPALEGDAELLAQYAAGRLGELDNVEQLNKEMIGEFGPEVEPHLPEIRQRAFQIRKDARIAELEAAGTKPNRRKTILSEIQNEIGQARKAAKAADTAEAKQREQKEASIRNVESFTAKAEARKAREQEQKAKQATAKEARQRLAQARQEYQEADKAEKKGYRASIKQQRDFERTAKLWDTPIRNAAKDARTRLANATDSKAPETISDLTAVMAEKMLPEEIGGSPRKGGKSPAALYTELKQEFPNLATDKNKSQVFKQAYEQVDTMAKAAREASRLRGASAESKKLWEQSGMDIDTQALLIQRAARTQKLLESNKRLAREFERVSQSRFKKVANEVLAAPRALQTALNFHIGRQGLFYLVTHPLAVSKGAVGATLKGYAALKPEQYVRAVEELQNHPDYDLGKKAGLNVAELPSDVGGNLSQAVEEDLLQSTWASKLPHVRLSQQGFALGMNTERVNAFSLYAKAGKMAGYTFETNPDFFKQAASVVNDATGRGSMPKAIESMAGITNKLFYATRLNVSRVKLLNDLFNPIKYQQYDPVMRKIMVKETARLVAGMAAMYGAAHMLGLKTSADPDDPDFGKVVWGTHHYDISGGEAQNIRFAFRFMRGIKNLMEGEKQPDNQDPLTLAGHFARGKLAPLPGAVMDYLYGKDVIGHPANLKIQSPGKMMNENIAARMLVPLVVKDYMEAYQEDGWGGVAKSTPITAGFGVQDYAETGVKALKNAPVAKELKRLNITHLSDSTKDEKLDADINQRVTDRVEAMKAPEGTDVGREKILRDKLEQARTLSKAESALADPKRYGDYLKSQKTTESMSFLTDEEKSKLTDDDLKRYRSAYVDSYLSLLQKVASGDAYKAMDDDKKEKALGRISAVAATTAKRQALQERRK